MASDDRKQSARAERLSTSRSAALMDALEPQWNAANTDSGDSGEYGHAAAALESHRLGAIARATVSAVRSLRQTWTPQPFCASIPVSVIRWATGTPLVGAATA